MFLLLIFLSTAYGLCPPNYVVNKAGTKCFLSVNDGVASYLEAQRNCSARGGNLAVIENAFDNSFVKSLTTGIYAYWMGLANMGAFGWTWIDGTPIEYNNWQGGFPTPKDTCGMFDPMSGGWYSEPCVDLYGPYICSAPLINQMCPGTTEDFKQKSVPK